jgi:hypothetical protein
LALASGGVERRQSAIPGHEKGMKKHVNLFYIEPRNEKTKEPNVIDCSFFLLFRIIYWWTFLLERRVWLGLKMEDE